MSTYTPIASVTLSSAQSSVTFSGIPQTYTDLVLICAVKNTANNGDEVAFQLNSDTGSNYSRTRIFGDGSTAQSGRASNTTKGALGINSTAQFSTIIANFQNYSNATTYKTVVSRGSDASNYVSAYVSLWRNTNEITSIVLLPDSGTTFASGSTFNLYGVDSSLSAQAKAYGGDTIVTDGTYWYHTFYSSGTFTPTEELTADYLVVAGGGAGAGSTGGNNGGGGGAGGLRSTVTATGGGGSLESALSLTVGTAYTVTVGAGGAGVYQANGANGSNSVFYTITSTGGGGGGANTNDGVTGGSGGGSVGTTNKTGGSGTANEGFAGGGVPGTITSPGYRAGGGGGAGAVGADGNNAAATGGVGVAVSISGSSVTYAGGGGGGSNDSAPAGGNGGGGTGGRNSPVINATNGSANLGAGGGGNAANGNFTGGNGGSGIVIVRYAV